MKKTPSTVVKIAKNSPEPRRKFLEKEYLRYFTPNVSPMWQDEDYEFSLEQPSPNKPIQTETTYGIVGEFPEEILTKCLTGKTS